ncbi:TPA: aspartate-semialdehyde dehydrogenase [Legionella pneumophila]|uniref:aspartate-semialdehyde dehydrogenase n=1 Tax=Legionella sp. PATHC039 TaxID=2992042 RepID=UPI0007785CC1|nr:MULTISPECIES: aspartate-semialdehyde dehydrogenase [Legionella]HAT8857559.1 aspartate-semialdehyde dehydrogenase [Legionella pneumophila subsp. pneumophila]MCW8394227.1 aspartate-semialdehyde dehydrogenase [Legionella sp. PATHC039]HAT7071567.1 aspartate-semialdehyde dehydrogenase [Legionella pneumophila]HAT8641745.1 aspartate-semialdehyde dehydrogenase [Legionella pneumophila]HAT8866751.1 aspartate-semialdehyde dehydrogenase [Legionella pneumophila subsp. pneumophila]
MSRYLNVAIVGATGAVGETFLTVLEERNFPIKSLYPLASSRSVGKTVTFRDQELDILDLAEFDFSKVDLALFSAGGAVSKEYAPKAVAAGCVVVDNTSCFRYEDDIPLVVPEVNPHRIADYTKRGIIANPNCSTIQMVVALKPIYDAVGISRINVATYQSVSGTGKKAISELVAQVGDLLNGRPANVQVYPQQIAFNALPHIDQFEDNGYTREEMKMVWETRKIMEDDSIMVNPTAVRVPVIYGHSEAVHLELKKPLTADDARALLAKAPGVTVVDNLSKASYPTAIKNAVGHDDVFVGRIRQDISHPCGLNLWIVADNIRKGAATNAVQIAEILQKEFL